MRKERFYKLSILTLILCNIGLMFFMWLNRPPHPPHDRMEKLSLVLGLKGKNKAAVDELEREHHIEKRMLVERDSKLHQELFVLLEQSSASDSLYQLIDQNASKTDRMTFEFFTKVASYCNETQKSKLRSFLKESLEQLHGPKPKGPFGR